MKTASKNLILRKIPSRFWKTVKFSNKYNKKLREKTEKTTWTAAIIWERTVTTFFFGYSFFNSVRFIFSWQTLHWKKYIRMVFLANRRNQHIIREFKSKSYQLKQTPQKSPRVLPTLPQSTPGKNVDWNWVK